MGFFSKGFRNHGIFPVDEKPVFSNRGNHDEMRRNNIGRGPYGLSATLTYAQLKV